MINYFDLEMKKNILYLKHPYSSNDGDIKILNYDFSNYVQEEFELKNVEIYAAANYIALGQKHDFLSQKIVYNKKNDHKVVAVFGKWYMDLLIKENKLELPAIIITVPRASGRRDQLKQLREYISENFSNLHPYEILIKNEDVNMSESSSDKTLYSLNIENYTGVENFHQGIVVVDDVITRGDTLKQCVNVIRDKFNGKITWVALSAAATFREKFKQWNEK